MEIFVMLPILYHKPTINCLSMGFVFVDFKDATSNSLQNLLHINFDLSIVWSRQPNLCLQPITSLTMIAFPSEIRKTIMDLAMFLTLFICLLYHSFHPSPDAKGILCCVI